MSTQSDDPLTALPPGWTTRVPELADVARLAALRAAQSAPYTGSAGVDVDQVTSEVAGPASWTRRQVLVCDPGGEVRAWAHAHDRAAGRAVIGVEIDRTVPRETQVLLAGACYDWLALAGRQMAEARGLDRTQLDAGAYSGDGLLRDCLAAAGYHHVRTWWQMSRPVTSADAAPGAFRPPKPGVTVRPVAQHDNGIPVAEDLNAVHQVLETAFADHFNSYQEYFSEFVQRLREDPGHRWDHWWLAFMADPDEPDAEPVAAGALVGAQTGPDSGGVRGSYVEYLGAIPESRGRGVATALLAAVVVDAAERGRNRVGLEVDADSPTGAEALYESLGWATKYTTESWHLELVL